MGAAASANAANPDFQETAKKSVATLTEFFDLQASMATGKVDEGKMAEFGAKLAGCRGEGMRLAPLPSEPLRTPPERPSWRHYWGGSRAPTTE